MIRHNHIPAIITLLLFMILFVIPGASAEVRVITDMRGKAVQIPDEPKRVATIDDGFVENIMTHLGVIDKITAIGSWGLKHDYRYEFEGAAGEKYEHRGWNTMKYLHPWLDDLPCVSSPQGDALNLELLVKSEPDLVILRVGDCTVGEGDKEKLARTIDSLEALELPLVVLNTPGYYCRADLSTLTDEIAIVGEAFGQREKALELATYLRQTEEMIRERTASISEAEKSRVLYLGLNPDLRKNGAAGAAFGVNTPESYMIESLINARNAFSGQGYGVPLNIEQIYALDPDVIILPTYNGYHPPRELYEAPYFASLSELRAVKNKKVYAMPWLPMNCAPRAEYPISMLIMAKAAYPDRFRDVDVYAFALRFYQDVYGVDEKTAGELRTTQLLDWMGDYDF